MNGFIIRQMRIALTLLLVAGTLAALGNSSSCMAAEDPSAGVLTYLNDTIEWYRHVTSIDQAAVTPEEAIFRDTVRQNASQALRLAFAYARGEAALIVEQSSGAAAAAGTTRNAALAQSAAAASQRIAHLQTEIDHVNAELKSATQPSDPVLLAQRDKLIAALSLARARQETLQGFIGFNSGGQGLLAKIDELERATPEAADQTKAPAATTANPAPAQSNDARQLARPESLGLLGMITELFDLNSKASNLREATAMTESLRKTCDVLRAPLRTKLQDVTRQGDALSQLKETDSASVLADQRQQLETLTTRFKLVTAAAVPLGEQKLLFDSASANLAEWRKSVEAINHRVLRALIVRLSAVALSIVIVLGISAIWRRATFRYVTDMRRRRQFLSIRRLIVGAIIVVIIVGGVITEFSTLITFAGLITAGIAVALQTVILSGVAHLFFIGRYGVRVGDRVTIAGITGDVIDIGIFRMYMMELSGPGRDLNPTGRIVIFSNSVLFQPTAFYKQLPGADYSWHEVAMTLAPDTDHQLAEDRLMKAVQRVYGDYRSDIEAQYATLKDTVHYPLPAPEPRGQLRLVDSGLEYAIRYPVDIRRSAEVDDRITRELVKTIEDEPKLRLVASGTPRIQPSAG